MLRVTSATIRTSQYDWLDRDIDWGEEEIDPLDVPGRVTPENYKDYLVDEIEPGRADDSSAIPTEKLPPDYPYRFFPPDYPSSFLEELPTARMDLGVPEESREIEYDDPYDLIQDSLGYEIISFEYTNRHGVYSGRRTVEPHDWFIAGTGNNIVVGFDLGVRDIRAFIIDNIHPGGVRFEGSTIPDRTTRGI